MAKTAWPTGTELTNAVTGLGESIPSGYTADDLIAAAIEQFERDTGHGVWLPPMVDDVRRFDPPHSYVLFVPSYWAITEVKTGVYGGSSGTVLTAGTDYWAEPHRTGGDKRPVLNLRFAIVQAGYPQSIQITGKPGYSDEIPYDAWQAVLDMAAAQALTYAAGPSGSISEVKEGLTQIKYGQGDSQTTVDRLRSSYKAAVMRYARLRAF